MNQYPICPECGHPYCPNCGQALGQIGSTGVLGEPSCAPVAVEPHPTAYYLVSGGIMPVKVAEQFNQMKNGYGDYSSLMGANVGWWIKGFSVHQASCLMNGWKNGIIIRVPKAWLDISTAQFSKLAARTHLVKEDGTPWSQQPAVQFAPRHYQAIRSLWR
jgi:hypothetical protein